jgi:hypothetical protein
MSLAVALQPSMMTTPAPDRHLRISQWLIIQGRAVGKPLAPLLVLSAMACLSSSRSQARAKPGIDRASLVHAGSPRCSAAECKGLHSPPKPPFIRDPRMRLRRGQLPKFDLTDIVARDQELAGRCEFVCREKYLYQRNQDLSPDGRGMNDSTSASEGAADSERFYFSIFTTLSFVTTSRPV